MATLAIILDNMLGYVNTVLQCYTDISEDTKKPCFQGLVPLFRCQGCSNNFSDECQPRNLSCGHTLCNPCTEALLAGEMPCPECCQKHQISTDGEPEVNYQLLRVIRSVGIKEINIGGVNSTMLTADFSQHHNKQDLRKCVVHNSPKVLFCLSCNSWVCENCIVVDHPILPRGSCWVIQLTEAIDKIRTKYEEVASQVLKEIETMKDDFELEFGMHDLCLKHCTQERSHLRLLEELNPLLLGKREENDEEVRKAKGRLKELADSFRATNAPEEMTVSCKGLLDFQEELKGIITQEKERLTSPRPIMVEHLRMDIKRLAEGREPLYATLQENGRHRWAHVALKDQTLLVYALNEGKPPSEGITLPYKFVEALLENRKKTLFLELEADGENLQGRVFVQLQEEGPMQQQMLLMCSGKKDVSFRNTRFFRDEEGYLSGGVYHNADGSKGGTIVPGLGECWGVSLSTGMKNYCAAVVGHKTSTKFHFILRPSKKGVDNIVGFVRQGLHVIKAAAKLEPVTKCYVKDCGIFIPVRTVTDCDKTVTDNENESTE
ncbi:uncharacterized protein LOC135209558 [Macrobrachium nipponense]|uniref:uncharacterized protein LOC135209558 n=1 Tax=Macrobrachium nipponense TaxID=159736 RepID=UPI0030C8AA42